MWPWRVMRARTRQTNSCGHFELRSDNGVQAIATKPPLTPAKPPGVTTATLKQLAPDLAAGHGLTKKQIEEVLGSLVGMVTTRLKTDEKVRLTGLGILQVRARLARTGRNSATGQAIEVRASKKIAFSAAKELKNAV